MSPGKLVFVLVVLYKVDVGQMQQQLMRSLLLKLRVIVPGFIINLSS